ncbi:MAG: hypothetical protein H6705_18465 [Myxococcales bacterium]|nr:hypothetical protein [Myxococcales bacterium]
MWRALLPRRLALLALAVGAAVAVSWWWAGPVPPAGYRAGEPAANLAAHFASAHGLVADPLELRVVDAGSAMVGRSVVVWFTAGEPADLYTARARLSAAGIPIAVGAPRNVSETADGHELLLDADARRVLYAVQLDDRVASVAALDFGESALGDGAGIAARWAAAFDGWQRFGVGMLPRRVDVRLEPATTLVFGGFEGEAAVLTTDGGEVVVDLTAGTAAPSTRARVLAAAPVERAAGALIGDALRRSAVVGAERLLAIEGARLAVGDWLRRQRHRLFPTAADRLPPALIGEPVAAGSEGWPPPSLAGEGLPGEGRWVAAPTMADAPDPAVLTTFVRVDPERPYQRTYLFAFDMRRLGLHFVAGAREPRSTTGARGAGAVAAAHRARLVAAFNGGLPAALGRFGVVDDGRALVPPTRGLATVVTDDEGQAGFGLWDAEALAAPWVGLRQNLAPLIEAGVVNPRRVRHWGQRVAALDDAQASRSALGVTAAGVLVYGWSAATSAERLGEALRRAGVVFAMHLDLGGETGLGLYRAEGDAIEAVRGANGMSARPTTWLGAAPRDFFYVVRAERAPPPLALADARPGEGAWRPVQRIDGVAVIAQSYIDAERIGARRQVPVWLLEADRLRAHVVPGIAEVPPAMGAPPAEVGLPAPPVAWFEAGLRAVESRDGLVVGGRTWQAPAAGAMTLAVDAAGAVAVGRYGEVIPVGRRWAELVQGPALVAGGEVVAAAAGEGSGAPSDLGREPVALGLAAPAPSEHPARTLHPCRPARRRCRSARRPLSSSPPPPTVTGCARRRASTRRRRDRRASSASAASPTPA